VQYAVNWFTGRESGGAEFGIKVPSNEESETE
jgi:hypothetical protein